MAKGDARKSRSNRGVVRLELLLQDTVDADADLITAMESVVYLAGLRGGAAVINRPDLAGGVIREALASWIEEWLSKHDAEGASDG